tara:strand:- start:25109 stop:25387 length:279 start_codon:yes stop_codon:yes gene_type:complete
MNPISDKVVLKPIDAQDVTTGGVIIPETAQDATMMGEIVAVGPGFHLMNGDRGSMQTSVGDKVVYPKHGCKKFEQDGEEYLIIREPELLVIL